MRGGFVPIVTNKPGELRPEAAGRTPWPGQPTAQPNSAEAAISQDQRLPA